jgi:hypothetical protein
MKNGDGLWIYFENLFNQITRSILNISGNRNRNMVYYYSLDIKHYSLIFFAYYLQKLGYIFV